jgi:hypothetical protein
MNYQYYQRMIAHKMICAFLKGVQFYRRVCGKVQLFIQIATAASAKQVPGRAGVYRLDYTLDNKPYTLLIKNGNHYMPPMMLYAAFETKTKTGELVTIDCTDLYNQLLGPCRDFHGCDDITVSDVYACTESGTNSSRVPNFYKFVTIDDEGILMTFEENKSLFDIVGR